jgi:hypothetical protein
MAGKPLEVGQISYRQTSEVKVATKIILRAQKRGTVQVSGKKKLLTKSNKAFVQGKREKSPKTRKARVSREDSSLGEGG